MLRYSKSLGIAIYSLNRRFLSEILNARVFPSFKNLGEGVLTPATYQQTDPSGNNVSEVGRVYVDLRLS